MRTALYLASIATLGAFALAAPSAHAQRRNGGASSTAALATGDAQDGDGHFYRTRAVQLQAGDVVGIGVDSTEFDTVLRVTGPDFTATNDDAEGQGTNSRLTFRVATTGTYQVTVTSYNAGETGSYSLSIRHGVSASELPDQPADDSNPAPGPAGDNNTPPPSDNAAPTATGWAWDDTQHMFVPSNGSPAAPNNVAPSDGSAANPFAADNGVGAGTVYGVFVGISAYGGGNDLDDTANDARNLAGAFERVGLIHHGNAIVLTDDQATTEQVRQAFETLGPRVTAHDTFVFFFDGHGDTNEVELVSGPATASDINRMLSGIRGEQLVVLDSCYSGSIASIIRGHDNRIGLFSSRANETSFVASPVHAGGWLAYFMIEAVRQRIGGRDGSVHLADIVTYVQHGYGERVHGQQHLVVAAPEHTMTLWHATRPSDNVALAR